MAWQYSCIWGQWLISFTRRRETIVLALHQGSPRNRVRRTSCVLLSNFFKNMFLALKTCTQRTQPGEPHLDPLVTSWEMPRGFNIFRETHVLQSMRIGCVHARRSVCGCLHTLHYIIMSHVTRTSDHIQRVAIQIIDSRLCKPLSDAVSIACFK